METGVQKAGCVLINREMKKIGLIYRAELDDYSFPKGHLEDNETLQQCAIRETEEETGRLCEIVKPEFSDLQHYTSPSEGLCIVHTFLAIDKGKSKQVFDESLVHELVWIDIDNVEKRLTYQDLKLCWRNVLIEIKKILFEN